MRFALIFGAVWLVGWAASLREMLGVVETSDEDKVTLAVGTFFLWPFYAWDMWRIERREKINKERRDEDGN